MDADQLADSYLRAAESADTATIVGLFAPGGIVNSPLYGPTPAAEFYPLVFSDTGSADMTLRAVMRGTDRTGSALVSFYFHYDWRFPDGTAAPFDVVDVARLDDEGRIAELTIIYDTVDVRPAFEAATGRRSWRVPSPDAP